MKLVIEDHDLSDLAGSDTLADHMHQAHHWALGAVRHYSDDALALAHGDDHEDMGRNDG